MYVIDEQQNAKILVIRTAQMGIAAACIELLGKIIPKENITVLSNRNINVYKKNEIFTNVDLVIEEDFMDLLKNMKKYDSYILLYNHPYRISDDYINIEKQIPGSIKSRVYVFDSEGCFYKYSNIIYFKRRLFYLFIDPMIKILFNILKKIRK